MKEPNIVWDIRKGVSELSQGDEQEIVQYIDALRSRLDEAADVIKRQQHIIERIRRVKGREFNPWCD